MSSTQSQWHAVYTRSRNEKIATERLCEKGFEAWIPLHKVIRQWSDRKKLVVEPLIRSYVFVKIATGQHYEVLNTPGIVRYLYFCGKPATIPEKQINTLKAVTGNNIPVECIDEVASPGERIMISRGPLKGHEGELIRHHGRSKVLVRIDHLDSSIMLNLSPALLIPLRDN